MHDRAARVTATRTVLEQGQQVADYIAEISPLCATNLSAEQWRLFYRLVDGLHAAQHDLQFVSVTRDGVTLLSRQVPAMAEAPASTATSGAPRASISRQVLELGGHAVPVIVFRREMSLPAGGGEIDVEVGVRPAAVDREEQASTRAIDSLFRLSVLTLSAAFGICLVLLIWVVRRDRVWSERRRQEEHLAFSGVLANGIVHDFRNPMSSVRLDAQMLERESRRPEGARPERLADLAGRIDHTVSRMDKVFQEFLYLARPAEEAQEPVDLAECVRECLVTLAPRMEQAGVTPAIVWPAPPPRILASPFALRRALINVLLNAVQFSPVQGRIEIDARVAGNRVELDILDRGPGIPAPDRRRIFEMFVTTRPGGTGLGLFLARTAIRKCGGEIAALPRECGGACIRMTLRQAADSGCVDGGRWKSETNEQTPAHPSPFTVNPAPSTVYPPPKGSP